jgi:hypothetical protein
MQAKMGRSPLNVDILQLVFVKCLVILLVFGTLDFLFVKMSLGGSLVPLLPPFMHKHFLGYFKHSRTKCYLKCGSVKSQPIFAICPFCQQIGI